MPVREDPWEGALCREDPDLFFPVGSRGPAAEQIEEAKATCRRCPLIEQCRRELERWPGAYGVWAGTSEDDRINERRRLRRLART
jgi:WhiB family redox-sensing transcriptional regulator